MTRSDCRRLTVTRRNGVLQSAIAGPYVVVERARPRRQSTAPAATTYSQQPTRANSPAFGHPSPQRRQRHLTMSQLDARNGVYQGALPTQIYGYRQQVYGPVRYGPSAPQYNRDQFYAHAPFEHIPTRRPYDGLPAPSLGTTQSGDTDDTARENLDYDSEDPDADLRSRVGSEQNYPFRPRGGRGRGF